MLFFFVVMMELIVVVVLGVLVLKNLGLQLGMPFDALIFAAIYGGLYYYFHGPVGAVFWRGVGMI